MVIIAPGSSLLTSTSTGAPSALARSLGAQELTKGTAVKATPTAPMPAVAAVRKLRRRLSTSSLIKPLPPTFQCWLFYAPGGRGDERSGSKNSRSCALYTNRMGRLKGPQAQNHVQAREAAAVYCRLHRRGARRGLCAVAPQARPAAANRRRGSGAGDAGARSE